MTFKWVGLEEVYNSSVEEIKRGSIVSIYVELDSLVDEYDQNYLKPFLKDWTYDTHDKTIKPFKLIDFKIKNNSFEVTYKVKNKNENINELNIFCKDIVDYYNISKVSVTKISANVHK